MPLELRSFRPIYFANWLLCTIVIVLSSVATAAEEDELFVLMHNSGKIERYDLQSGQHRGTLISGLPPSNAILPAPDGCWLVSTGKPGEAGNVLRFDPRGDGSLTVLIDIPEGYGGRVLRPSGMTWWGDQLLVASQTDGKVKCYDYPSGQWLGDVATASRGAMTQISWADNRLWITDYATHSINLVELKRIPEVPLVSRRWAHVASEAPWGVACHPQLGIFWSTASGRIYRANTAEESQQARQAQPPDHKIDSRDEWHGVPQVWVDQTARLATPLGLMIGPDQRLYCASLGGNLSIWRTDMPSVEPLQVLAGPEVQGPASVAVATAVTRPEFLAPNLDPLAQTPEKVAFFENKVRPLLHAHCLDCHSEQAQEGGLRLDSRHAWQQGGRSGPAVIPGQPEASLLYQAIIHLDKDLKMPPDQRLSLDEISVLANWIRNGAIDPRDQPVGELVAQADDQWAAEFQSRLDWWSLKPLRRPTVPTNHSSRQLPGDWARSPVDRFIEQQLESHGLQPAGRADPDILLRRLAIVLTGLPPSPELCQQFLERSQSQPDSAYAWLVDRLLQSPHYGERLARHWMDAVRYTDTYGYEWDNPAKGSHEYRDYLIRAFNNDVPYDTLVREQLAGDLLDEPRIDAALAINESIIGPMFYHLGEHRHGSSLAFNGIHQEMVNNKIDAFSKVFLATTVSCARCHDHKREPVSQRDYYALGALFMTPRWVSRPVDAPHKHAHALEQLKELRSRIAQHIKSSWTAFELTSGQLRQLVSDLKKVEKPREPALEEVLYPLWKLYSAANDNQWPATWQALTSEFQSQRAGRLKNNQNFDFLSDGNSDRLPDGWVVEGDGIENGWVEHGEILVALEGEQLLAELLPRGWHTHALSSKLPGVVRMPPQHTVPGAFTSLLLAGGQFSGALVMDENSFQNETVTFFNQPTPVWRTYADAELKNGVTRVTIDIATASLNPNFPPRTGLAAGLPNNDMGYDKRSWFSLCGIVSHSTPAPPTDPLECFVDLYEQTRYQQPLTQPPLPAGCDSARCAIEAELVAWLERAVRRWCAGTPARGDIPLINFLLRYQLLPNSMAGSPELEELVGQYRRVEASIAHPRSVNSMDEREQAKAGLYFNVRGNVDAMGQLVTPDGLSMFPHDAARIAASLGSGRLELAESLLQPDHPLTARVYVNRVWQWVFGEGLVRTPDDFGRLGEQPSHPELLDWLACEFIRQGWSTKWLIRTLVLSQTFQQSSRAETQAATELAVQVDPANRLWHHYPTRRLEAEAVRDSLLAVSGRLDRQLYGRPINPPRTVEDGAKRLFSGPLDGYGRRSLYLTMSIMAPPKFLTTFDLPDLKLPSGRRNVTNVPSQALQMLNDPLVMAMAEQWADDTLAQEYANVTECLRAMIQRAYARPATERELEAWLGFIQCGESDEVSIDKQIWQQVAHGLFNTKEFLYFR